MSQYFSSSSKLSCFFLSAYVCPDDFETGRADPKTFYSRSIANASDIPQDLVSCMVGETCGDCGEEMVAVMKYANSRLWAMNGFHHVNIWEARCDCGDIVYQGAADYIENFNNRLLMHHDILLDYLTQCFHGGMTFTAWRRAKTDYFRSHCVFENLPCPRDFINVTSTFNLLHRRL